MPDSGYKTPTAATQTGTGTSWTGLTNAYALDSAYVECQQPAEGSSKQLWLTGFDFSAIPTGKIPVGIEVQIHGTESEDYNIVYTELCQIIYGGSLLGTAKTDGNAWEDNDPLLGGASDLFGITGLTLAMVKSSTFGIAIAAKKLAHADGATVISQLDTVGLKIHYADDTTILGTIDNATLPGLTGKAHHRVN